MGTISVSLPSDGTTADVADYNTPITTIVNEFNGSIDNSNVSASAAIATSKLADDNGIGANKLSNSAITLGYAQVTSNATATSLAAVAGLSVTVTIPTGSRRVKITAWTHGLYTVASTNNAYLSVWDGTVGSGTKVTEIPGYTNGAVTGAVAMAVLTPTGGASKTYNVGLQNSGSGTATMEANALYPAFILVEAI